MIRELARGAFREILAGARAGLERLEGRLGETVKRLTVSPEGVDLEHDDDTVPPIPVVLSDEAKRMLEEGSNPEPTEPPKKIAGPLKGSSAERALRNQPRR